MEFVYKLKTYSLKKLNETKTRVFLFLLNFRPFTDFYLTRKHYLIKQLQHREVYGCGGDFLAYVISISCLFKSYILTNLMAIEIRVDMTN